MASRMLPIEDIAYYGLLLAAPAVCAARALQVRDERLAWSLLAGGLAAWVAADVYYALGGSPDSPSLADAGWLAIYPASYCAIVLLVRGADRAHRHGTVARRAARRPARPRRWWSRSSSARSPTPASARPPRSAINLAYPLGDTLLVGFVVAAIGADGLACRPRPGCCSAAG